MLDFFRRDLCDVVAGHLVGGVVDEHIEASELGVRLLDQALAVGSSLMSPGTSTAATARFLDEAGGLAGVVVFVEIGDKHVGTLAGEGDGNRTADAAVAAGDDGGLVLEFTAAR